MVSGPVMANLFNATHVGVRNRRSALAGVVPRNGCVTRIVEAGMHQVVAKRRTGVPYWILSTKFPWCFLCHTTLKVRHWCIASSTGAPTTSATGTCLHASSSPQTNTRLGLAWIANRSLLVSTARQEDNTRRHSDAESHGALPPFPTWTSSDTLSCLAN